MNEPRGYTTPDDPDCTHPSYEQCDRCGRLVCPLCEGLCNCPDEMPEGWPTQCDSQGEPYWTPDEPTEEK